MEPSDSMLRRLEEYLGHRRSLGYALPIEGDMLLDFCSHRHEHVFDTYWYLSATPERFVAACDSNLQLGDCFLDE